MTESENGADTAPAAGVSSGPNEPHRASVRMVLLWSLLVYFLVAMSYSALSGIVAWQDLNPALPVKLYPFETWAMFKLFQRHDPLMRLEGTYADGRKETIPSDEVLHLKSLEGRTALDHSNTSSLLRMDSVVRRRRRALARAIQESDYIRRREFSSISVFLDVRDLFTSEVYARIELLRVDRPGPVMESQEKTNGEAP